MDKNYNANECINVHKNLSFYMEKNREVTVSELTCIEVIKYKKCTDCKKNKKATKEYFAKNKNTLDGFQSICKVCQKKRRDTVDVIKAREERERIAVETKEKYEIELKNKRERLKVSNPNKYIFKVGEVILDDLEVIAHTIIEEGLSKIKRRAYIIRCRKCGDVQTKEEKNLKRSIERNGKVCLVCMNRKVVYGVNSIHDTDKWMLDLGVDFEEAKFLTSKSEKEISVVCPDCGKKFSKRLEYIYKDRSIGCSCSDCGKSYAERVMAGVLNQLGVDYEPEYSPKWAKPKRYDFYLHSINTIIEVHGAQHYINTNRKYSRSLQEEQENDRTKYENATKNGIERYIIIDARESELVFIKNSILKSLKGIFDFRDVNWVEVDKFATKNIIKEICDHYNNTNLSSQELASLFKVSQGTIIKYLHKGTKLGWCKYVKETIAKKCIVVIDGEVIKADSMGQAIDYIRNKYIDIKIAGYWFAKSSQIPIKYKERVTFVGSLDEYETYLKTGINPTKFYKAIEKNI